LVLLVSLLVVQLFAVGLLVLTVGASVAFQGVVSIVLV
jgi:hypothetical protein